VLTAFGFGKPVVASRVGGIPEYVEHGLTGELVEPNDSAALAEALVRLLLDTPTRLHMKENVQKSAQGELSWREFAGHMRGVYERAVSRPPRPAVEEVPSA
jgi:glycosyltransferase involved in cell wall biosynthesis